MTEQETLKVLYTDQIVGYLKLGAEGHFEFSYAQLWLESVNSWPISRTLPLNSNAVDREHGHRFFANLLPEGRVRHLVTRRLGISEDNDFALLKAVGGECAGALRILPEEDVCENEQLSDYRPLPIDELTKIAVTGLLYPVFAHEGAMRLSLAGAQDKLPVLCRDDNLFLPQGDLPSSHILKFANRDFKYLPENEVIVMWLATECGLPVAETKLLQKGTFRVCQVKRYDRIYKEATLIRIHQEDFCQALGYSRHMKYEQEGGPTLAKCVALVQHSSDNPLADTETIIKWHLFNLLVGNADGHAKNLSLVYKMDGSVRLAPLYDLVCTAVYPGLDNKMALATGDTRDPGQLTAANWRQMATQIDMQSALLIEQIPFMVDRVQEKSVSVFTRFRDMYGDSPVIERIEAVIKKRVRSVLRSMSR